MDKFAGTNIATSAGGEVLGSRDAAIESGNTLDFVRPQRARGETPFRCPGLAHGPLLCFRLSLGFAFVPPLARGSGFAFARSRAIAFLPLPVALLAGRPAGLLCHGCWNLACWESGS